MSWLGCDQEGRGLSTSEGVKEGAVLQTINPDIRSQREQRTKAPEPPAFFYFP